MRAGWRRWGRILCEGVGGGNLGLLSREGIGESGSIIITIIIGYRAEVMDHRTTISPRRRRVTPPVLNLTPLVRPLIISPEEDKS